MRDAYYKKSSNTKIYKEICYLFYPRLPMLYVSLIILCPFLCASVDILKYTEMYSSFPSSMCLQR